MDSLGQPTAATGALTLHPNNEKNSTPVIEYSDEAKKYINFRRQRMIAARDTRDMVRDEYDGMGFLQWYEVQKKADDQFLAPRKNKQDTSINTGTIRDKDSSLLEYAQKYDFEPVAQVYDDEDEMLEELAETTEDLIRKSFLMEDAKMKGKLLTRSMISFGTALVEDEWMERWTIEKEFGTGKATIGSIKSEWVEKKVKQYDGAQIKLWDLRKCYFGDIRKFFMNGPQGQPYFFTVEYQSYDVVKTIFGEWDRWKYVPTYVVNTPEISSMQVYTQGWTLRPISMNYVEIARYYDPVANEFALTLNGVDMLPIMEKNTVVNGEKKCLISGFPLIAVSPSGAIPFSKFDLEPMHDFAYSKSQPAKMRILADLENMWLKLVIGMMKQKAKPTMGNKSGKQFGSEVTDPAEVINDIREGDLFPILPNYTGATPADFSFYEMLKKEMGKNSVDDAFQGIDNTQAEETATQNLNNMKAQSLKVAALFDGLVYGWMQLFWLRTYNIAKNWTKPIDQRIDMERKMLVDKYRTVNMSTIGPDGGNVARKVIFTKDTPKRPGGKATLEDSQDLHQQEMDTKKNGGKDVLITHLHPELFASMKLNWYYCCIPVINDTDPLAYMMFAKQIMDAINFFGPESLNVKKLKYRFAKITGQDYDTWFISQQELQQKQQEMAQAQAVNGGSPTSKPPAQPSIAGAVKGKVPQMSTVMQ